MNIFEYHELSVLLETVPRFRLRWKMVNHRQTLVLEGSIVTDNWGAMRHSIHDEDKSPLNDHSIEGTFESNTILWTPNSEKDSYKFYTRVECVNDWRGGGGQYNINVSIEDYYGDQGTDFKDLYNLSLESGETINVKLTPPDDVK